MQQVYLFCVVGVCTTLVTSSGLFLVFSCFLCSAVFTVSLPRKQTVSPPELLESNLIALHFLPAWLPFGANSKHCTDSVLLSPCLSSGAEERPWAFQQNMRTSPLASHVFTWTLIQNRPSIPKVNARAAFVGVCRCNPPKHTSCVQLGCLSELLVAMLADLVVCFCSASLVRTSFPHLRHEMPTDSFY